MGYVVVGSLSSEMEVKGEHEVLVLDGKGSIGDFSQVVNFIFL